ncbi:MAG TPA: ABC transporter substrate-binding protein [Streptosporangiaceae bacterium]|jgi:sulfonate transport system substrate-binding protein
MRKPISAARLPLIVLALVTVLVAAACSSSSAGAGGSSGSGSDKASTTSLSNVTLNIGDQKGTGAQALLTAAGLIKKLPFHAVWSDFTSGPPMLQAAGTGSVDVGGVGDAPPVVAAAGNYKVAMVGARTANPLSAALLLPKNSPIHSVAQLRGKKIAMAPGSSANYHLLAVLAKAGIPVSDVHLVDLQPAQALAAFASGQVDAWDVWSPYIEQAVAQDHARVLVTGVPYGATYSFEVASRAALANPAKARAIRAYLKLLNQAYVWSANHPAGWATSWAAATGLPASVMLTASKDSETKPVPVDSAVLSSEQSVADAFASAKLIPAKPVMSHFAVSTFNDTVPNS